MAQCYTRQNYFSVDSKNVPDVGRELTREREKGKNGLTREQGSGLIACAFLELKLVFFLFFPWLWLYERRRVLDKPVG